MNAYEGELALTRELVSVAAEALKTLLETKHLYQKVAIDIETAILKVGGHVVGDEFDSFIEIARAARQTSHFTVSSQQLFYTTEQRGGVEAPVLVLLLRNVKIFCDKCGARETFAPVWYIDAINEIRKPHEHSVRFDSPLSPLLQLFFLAYQCQTCKGAPVAFIVRRDGWDLYLEGRSPFEEVELPSFIPKQERHFYRDAMIAYHAGKILAALFYLRTFMEQFARRILAVTGKMPGDELMEKYSETLPTPTRDQMPSLRSWYEKLSEALHAADANAELFEKAEEDIRRHFDIRRVFKIPEVTEARDVPMAPAQ
jgi:hypothetical protein